MYEQVLSKKNTPTDLYFSRFCGIVFFPINCVGVYLVCRKLSRHLLETGIKYRVGEC